MNIKVLKGEDHSAYEDPVLPPIRSYSVCRGEPGERMGSSSVGLSALLEKFGPRINTQIKLSHNIKL